jgi:hypothetical protein
MQEGSLLMRRVAVHTELAHPATKTSSLLARAKELDRQADALRQMLANASTVPES